VIRENQEYFGAERHGLAPGTASRGTIFLRARRRFRMSSDPRNPAKHRPAANHTTAMHSNCARFADARILRQQHQRQYAALFEKPASSANNCSGSVVLGPEFRGHPAIASPNASNSARGERIVVPRKEMQASGRGVNCPACRGVAMLHHQIGLRIWHRVRGHHCAAATLVCPTVFF